MEMTKSHHSQVSANTADERLSDKAVRLIEEALLSGRYLPGDKLIIRELMSEMSMSMTPVREALLRISSQGILDGARQRSIVVKDLSLAQIDEIWSIRLSLETLAVENACSRINKLDLDHLYAQHDTIARLRQGADSRILAQEISSFYLTLYSISAMPTLVSTIRGLWLQSMPVIAWRLSKENYDETPDHRRSQLLDALQTHSVVRAVELIGQDIEDSRERINFLRRADLSANQN